MLGHRAPSLAGRSPFEAVDRPHEPTSRRSRSARSSLVADLNQEWSEAGIADHLDTSGADPRASHDRASLLPLPATAAAVAPLLLASVPGSSPAELLAVIVASAMAAFVALSIVPLANRAGAAFEDSGAGDLLLYTAALASAGAAAIHFSVIKMHFDEYRLYGVFFVASGVAQLVWPIWLLLRRWAPLLVLGAVGNAAIVVLWLVDRVGAMPIGPDARAPSPFGVGDSVASGFEVLLVVACVAALRRRKRHPLRARTNLALTLGTAALTTLSFLSALGVASSVLPPAM